LDEDETFPELMYSPYQLSGGGPQPQATTGGEAAGAPAPEPQPAPHHHYPQYVTSCYPFVQEQVYHPHVYFNPLHAHTHASPNLAYSSQRARKYRKPRRVQTQDKSLQCDLNSKEPPASTNPDLITPTNQPDPDSDSGYCSPKQKPSCVESSPPGVSQTDQPSFTQPPSQTQQPAEQSSQIRADPSLLVDQLQTEHSRQVQLPLQRPTSIPLHAVSIVSHTADHGSFVRDSRRTARKADRAFRKAELEYAEIAAEQERLVKRISQTNIASAPKMDAKGGTFKKKGKVKENPKQKKPTALKRVILKERQEKKEARERTESTDQSDDVPPLPPILDGIGGPETALIKDCVEASRIHSRRFREYCDQVIDKKIDNLTAGLLSELCRFYNRQLQKNPNKAKSKRRFVLGIREVFKHLKLNKIKCVIVSPNLEKIQSKGGLDDMLSQVLQWCEDHSLQVIFALGRRALGRACGKFVPVSIVGIFDVSGCEEQYMHLSTLVREAREQYQKLVGTVAREIEDSHERAQEVQAAEVDEEIQLDKLKLDKSLELSEHGTAQTAENGTSANEPVCSGRQQAQLVDDLIKGSSRKAYQVHSRNTSAASGVSIISAVSQGEDMNWREIVENDDCSGKTEEPV